LREILTHFRTRMDPKGLLHALQAVQAGYRDRTGIELVLDNRAADLKLSVEQEVQVFHIVQEALANVARHSQARQARVLIEQTSDQIDIAVDDDGAGLHAGAGTLGGKDGGGESHFGLEIMQERARRLGGLLRVEPRLDGGTRVQLRIPTASAKAKATA